jgi:hypothetical protein
MNNVTSAADKETCYVDLRTHQRVYEVLANPEQRRAYDESGALRADLGPTCYTLKADLRFPDAPVGL